MEPSPSAIAAGGLGVFLLEVVVRSAGLPGLFTGRYGRRHRLCGAVELALLILGAADAAGRCLTLSGAGPLFVSDAACAAYDVVLGISGTALALSAAYDFRRAHERVRNVASGALDDKATVTFSEMLEHSFYQKLNLVQIGYLHALRYVPASNLIARAGLAVAAVLPWLLRGWYPVNKFSDNYTKAGTDPASLLGILYRVKKYQYLFYKHMLLHGLNASAPFAPGSLATTNYFRLYWVAKTLGLGVFV